MRTERLTALCDGVFAIALTLLVLELPVPEESTRLAHDLAAAWPAYAAYIVSFATIAIVWVNHHALLDGVERADRGFLELNLLLLLCVSLVPWPTELLAAYLQDGEQATTAAIVYGLAMTAMSAAFAATWAYLRRRPALAAAALRPRLGSAARRSLVGPAAYLVGTALAPLVPVAAFAVFGGVAVFFLVSNRSAGALPA